MSVVLLGSTLSRAILSSSECSFTQGRGGEGEVKSVAIICHYYAKQHSVGHMLCRIVIICHLHSNTLIY